MHERIPLDVLSDSVPRQGRRLLEQRALAPAHDRPRGRPRKRQSLPKSVCSINSVNDVLNNDFEICLKVSRLQCKFLYRINAVMQNS